MKEGEGQGLLSASDVPGSPFNGFFNEYDGLTSAAAALGVKVDDQTRTVICTLDQPDIMENLKLLHQWYMDASSIRCECSDRAAEETSIFFRTGLAQRGLPHGRY